MRPEQYISSQEALDLVENGNRVFIQGGAATPVHLLNELLGRHDTLKDIELVSISLQGAVDWNRPGVTDSFYLNSLFVSANVRGWVNGDRGDYVPIFLSEIPCLFQNGILPLDVAIVQVSTPDEHGYCTLGPSVDITLSAVRNARKVIAQVNPLLPRVFGDGCFHISAFHALVYAAEPLAVLGSLESANDISEKIGRHVAELIDNGSTLQMGIGSVPDAVLRSLQHHRELGIHTEMFSDGVVSLVEHGVVTNEHKKVNKGKTVSSFVLGSQKVYDFINNNPAVWCMDASYVNDTSIIRKNPKVVAINSALEIDITGQVCADSLGSYQYSGIGGQMDFMRGAALSEGGKPIIALPSTTKDCTSRIVPFLKQGAGVVTTRGHVHYVATEYGVVNLYGKNMAQRARLLTSIAHPNHRESLEAAYFERFGQLI
ncbi:MAG: acetyl-CoA hydrolase/transferase family protein [Flavipsychrobacter sp.]|nr:acetyl-CoA hydrolase/transferase family protein [Flavipsychrobacter sp.]